MKPQAAVLTGDLIGSTSASQGAIDAAMKIVAGCFGAANGFTRFRGDGWQVYFDDPGYGLWALLRISAALRAAGGLESRIALGLGRAENVDLSNLAAASGSAFVASGRALSHIQKGNRFAMAGDGLDMLHEQLVTLIDERTAGWSQEQAEAAALAWSRYQHPTQFEIAQQLGISRQAVAARLKSAGFAPLDLTQWRFFLTFNTSNGTFNDDGHPHD
jgi:hypothetical protein